jgi:hypothetical protein
MAQSNLLLLDANQQTFEQLAANDNTGAKAPAVSIALWNGASPVPVSNSNAVPVSIINPSVLPVSQSGTWSVGLSSGSNVIGSINGINNTVPVGLPRVASAAIASVQTSATGANFTAFGSNACYLAEIANNTGTTIEYDRGTGTAFPIFNGTTRLIVGITNTNQIRVRRADTSNSQVTVQIEYYN